jgi:hypothetical protein
MHARPRHLVPMTTRIHNQRALQTHFSTSSLRAFMLLTMVALLLHASGCTRNNNQSIQLQKTNAFTRFKKIESIKLEWWHNLKEPVVCDVPESKWDAFESIFENGIRDPNAVKRDSWGNMELVADGKSYHWALLTIDDNECGLFISIKELWAGIRTSDIDKFVSGCLEENQRK